MIIQVKNPIVGPSQKAISSFEDYARNSLPEDFKTFLDYGNGGEPETNIFATTNGEKVVERFLPLMDDPDSNPSYGQYDISVVETQIGERLASDFDQVGCTLIPFAALFGGDFLCFDYRDNPSRPTVVVWDQALSDEFSPSTILVANSFTDFVEQLHGSAGL